MSHKTEANQTPAKRGRGRPKGSTKPREPNAPPPPLALEKKSSKPPTVPIERKSWSRAEFMARHGIGSSNTYAAMMERGDGPKEMILGKGPHAVRRISIAEEERWIARQEAKVITEEERADDRARRKAAHAANIAEGR